MQAIILCKRMEVSGGCSLGMAIFYWCPNSILSGLLTRKLTVSALVVRI
jgi:hypothetical protein